MFAFFKWKALFADWKVFVLGVLMTLAVSLIALAATLVISLVVGLVRCSNGKVGPRLSGWYMKFFQNTPLVVQVFFFYHVLPRMHIMLNSFEVGCIGLALYTGAFGAAVIEAAIKAVPKGQTEAAASQGFSYMSTMFRIILPQSIKIALPPMTNQAVNLIKNSSVLAMIAGGDLMYRADSWAAGNLFYGPSFLVTGLLYLSLCLPLSLSARKLEKRQLEREA